MLYISRAMIDSSTGEEHYAITDSDDDIETQVSAEELSNAIFKYNLNIVGVEIQHDMVGEYINSICVHQHEKWSTPQRMKAKVMLGVDIRLFKGEIRAILINFDAVKGTVRIRLSDYGNKLEWFAGIGSRGSSIGKGVILVLDDKIEMVGPVRPSIHGVRWDISEVNNEAMIKDIYEELITDINIPTIEEWDDCIIDRPERMEEWREFMR